MTLSAFYWRENMRPEQYRRTSDEPRSNRRKPSDAEALRKRVLAMIDGGMTTADIARQVNCSRRYIQKLVAGRR